jgi:hypothetical protein
MSLWNRFIKTHSTIADRSIPQRCAVFVRKYAAELKRLNLRQDFQLHLMNLWDAGVMSSEAIAQCLAEYDAAMTSVATVAEKEVALASSPSTSTGKKRPTPRKGPISNVKRREDKPMTPRRDKAGNKAGTPRQDKPRKHQYHMYSKSGPNPRDG